MPAIIHIFFLGINVYFDIAAFAISIFTLIVILPLATLTFLDIRFLPPNMQS